MSNKPAQVQRIRFPERKKKQPALSRKKRVWEWCLAFVLGVCVCWGISFVFHHRAEIEEPVREKLQDIRHQDRHGRNPHIGTCVRYPGKNINYASKFNDRNDLHLQAARSKGLPATPANRDAVEKMKGKMVPINNSANYLVDPLTHSVPYLCPGAARELDAIGVAFADILKRNDLPHYRFILTSVLRTQDDVTKLRGSGNVNASENSAHCYGTTFDITYTRFEKAETSDKYVPEDNLMLVLAQALLNEQRAGHIYVKFEKKQACFHITSRI